MLKMKFDLITIEQRKPKLYLSMDVQYQQQLIKVATKSQTINVNK